ncbi:putative crown gall tumor protein VirC1 [Escherichia coli]|uniref:Putative crown gall tumor protein VirC1 n=1 Tax=Escherichia coli TaxID=562 RepID=A0A377CXB6_ECOLX|nr:putative crown gall tumor protein VirC1 [Escherichia coli]
MFVNEANEAAEVLKDYPEMHLANSRVCDRKAHRDAWAEINDNFLKRKMIKPSKKSKALVKEVIL